MGPAVRAVHGPEDMRPSRIPPADAGAPKTELGRCFPMRSTPRTVRPTEMSGCAPRHPHTVPRAAEVHTSELPSCKPDARFWFNPSISCCLPLFPHGNPSTASLSPAGLHYAGPRGPSQRRRGGHPAMRYGSLRCTCQRGVLKGHVLAKNKTKCRRRICTQSRVTCAQCCTAAPHPFQWSRQCSPTPPLSMLHDLSQCFS